VNATHDHDKAPAPDKPRYDAPRLLEEALFDDEDTAAAGAGQKQKPLSAAKYLHWLAMETHAAHRATLENLAGFAQPSRLEPLKERTLSALPAALPPLVARFLEVQIRLAEDNIKAARSIAQKLTGLGEAFDAGVKLKPAAADVAKTQATAHSNGID